jgi:prevent-host-death family protein
MLLQRGDDMAKVGIRELKNNLSHYISLVKGGEQVVVTNRGQDVALIVPVEESDNYSRLIEMVKEGLAIWEGGKPIAPEPIVASGKPTSEIVLEDRR